MLIFLKNIILTCLMAENYYKFFCFVNRISLNGKRKQMDGE